MHFKLFFLRTFLFVSLFYTPSLLSASLDEARFSLKDAQGVSYTVFFRLFIPHEDSFDPIFKLMQNFFKTLPEKENITNLLEQKKGDLIIAYANDKKMVKLIGFAFLFPLLETGCTLLEHFAIIPDFQNQGLGTYFLSKIIFEHSRKK